MPTQARSPFFNGLLQKKGRSGTLRLDRMPMRFHRRSARQALRNTH